MSEGHCHGSWASRTAGHFLAGHPTSGNTGLQYVPLGKTTQSRGCSISKHNNLKDLSDNGNYKAFSLGVWDKSKAVSAEISVFAYTKTLNL